MTFFDFIHIFSHFKVTLLKLIQPWSVTNRFRVIFS